MELTRIFSSPKETSSRINEVLEDRLSKQFPIDGKHYRLEVSNVRAEPKRFDHEDEKDALLKSKSLTYPVKADLKLIDKATNKVVDQHAGFNLMDSFHLTQKHTVVYKGNNYMVANQLQLRPGVYTRHKDTGELESHFNTGSGRSFSLELDPQSGVFYIIPASTSSRIPLAPLLTKVFGVGPKEASKYVPSQVWDSNLAFSSGKESKVLADLYGKMVSTSKRATGASPEVMAGALKHALESSQLNAGTTKSTLGVSKSYIDGHTLLLAMKNLVDVHSGKRAEDNRDSLQFKRVQNLPDFLATRFDKDHQVVKNVKTKIARDLDRMDKNNPSIKSALVSKPFNRFFSDYILNSPLASTPSETNPIESVENVAKVTILGADEGGISSERAVPMSARDIDASHLGIIDPSRTAEGSHAGIDQRFTVSAKRDKEGNLYARVKDKQGKVKHLSVQDMMTHTIGFPYQEGKARVQAQVKGVIKEVPRSQVDYWIANGTDMYTATTNLIPYLNSNHPGRLTMASKALTQALSLVNREAPLVQTTNEHGHSLTKGLGAVVSTYSPVKGMVKSIQGKTISIQDEQGKVHRINGAKDIPFNMKGFKDDEAVLVKVGDKVDKDTPLFDNNYTRGGHLALGKNLEVAYLPYKGYNHEDGIVISRSAAQSMDSHHSYKIDYSVQESSIMKKSMVTRYFPGKFTRQQLDNLDERGFAKVGTVLKRGDPVYIVLEKREPTPEDKMLGRLHKVLVTPYRIASETWLHDEPGKVVDAHTGGKDVRFLIRSVKELEVGDKLTGLHGNKGIVSLILEDDKMPYVKETGKPVDLLLNPASVTSRVNLGQIMETAAGKIAKKTGKPYLVHNYAQSNNVKGLHEELAHHGLSDTDHMVDPITGKDLGPILTGPQYTLKLYKTSDQNFSARNVGKYDNVHQPVKGGEEGSKSIGYMEMLGLLGSDARKNLKEIATIKSEENSEYWSKFLTGQPLPKPKTSFATQKFFDYLKGSGINPIMKEGKIVATPLTDKDILHMSNGVIKEPLMISAKNLEPERGGLFDPAVTGGLRGNKWSHYKLAEPIAHPLMEKPIKSLLGLNTKEFTGIAHGQIGVKSHGKGIFDLHDVSSGNHIRRIHVNAGGHIEEDTEEPEHGEDDLLHPTHLLQV